jgi:hypothetical protein
MKNIIILRKIWGSMTNTALTYLRQELLDKGVANQDNIDQYILHQPTTPADSIIEAMFGMQMKRPEELRILRYVDNGERQVEAELILQHVTHYEKPFDALTLRVSDEYRDSVMGWELNRGIATLREAYDARACCPSHFMEDTVRFAPKYQKMIEETEPRSSKELIGKVVDEFRTLTWRDPL